MSLLKRRRCEVIGCPRPADESVQVETKAGEFICGGPRDVCSGHFKILSGSAPMDGSLSFVVEVVLSSPLDDTAPGTPCIRCGLTGDCCTKAQMHLYSIANKPSTNDRTTKGPYND